MSDKWPDKWRLIRRLSYQQGWRVISDFDTVEECLARRNEVSKGIPWEDLRILCPDGEDYHGAPGYSLVQRTGYLTSKVIFKAETYRECEEYLEAYFLENPEMVTVREWFNIRLTRDCLEYGDGLYGQ